MPASQSLPTASKDNPAAGHPPEEAGEPIVELDDVSVAAMHAPELIALDGVRWTIRRGDYWVLGGPPGSGKSDLLATAAGLMRPARGTHRLFGQDLNRLNEDERVIMQLRVGVVFGFGGRLFSHLTVAENLALPVCYHQNCDPTASDERVQSVLRALELEGIAQSTPGQLDRNLQQRTALARALMLSPEALFLDNPLVGTGARELRWWLNFLGALAQGHPLLEGRALTLVVGTSDLEHFGEHGKQFALVQGRRFTTLGSRVELARQSDPTLREWLPPEWFKE